MADATPHPIRHTVRGWRTWGGISAALVVAAAIVVAGAPREPDSVAHVRAYLTAIREGRVADALALAGVEKPSGEKGRFLTREAVTYDWEIVALREESHYDGSSSYPEEARVGVAIRAAGGATAVSALTLRKQGGEWTIEAPLQEVTLYPTGMLYVDVNGVKAPTKAATSESVYALLPGAYRFYTDVPGVAKVASTPVPVLPGVALPPGLSPTLKLTSKGKRAAQAALKAYLDNCARSTDLAPKDCPFGADPAVGPQGEEYRSLDDFRDISWKVDRYPDAAVVESGAWIYLADRERGSVRVTVTATEYDTGKQVRYLVTCEMRLNGYQLAVDADGRFVVLPPYARSPDSDQAPPIDTCRR